MVLLENVYIDVWRVVYTAGGGTSAPQPYMTNIPGHLTRVHDSMLVTQQSSTLSADYEVYVDPMYDIRRGDVITNIIRKDTRLPYFNQTDAETWYVLQSTLSEPGFGEYRDVNIGRYVAGGPAQSI